MRLSLSFAVVVVAAAGVAWSARDAGWVRRFSQALPGTQAPGTSTPPGVHKCRRADGQLVYTDRPCERGTREQTMGGGTLTTVPAMAPRAAPSAASGGLIQGLDPASIERLREQQIDAAAKR
jgi:hypothetical protein